VAGRTAVRRVEAWRRWRLEVGHLAEVQRWVAATALSVVAVAGCTSAVSPEAGPRQAPDADADADADAVAVTFDQAEALADGAVSEAEMSAAVTTAEKCLAELGVEDAAARPLNGADLASGWTFDVSGSALGAVAACREATYGRMELTI
jgi:hypothetical protein